MTRPVWFLLALALVAASPRPAPALSIVPPQSYSLLTPDGRHLLVILAPGPDSDSLNEESRALRDKYPASGLYPKDGPATPLWTVDWYANRNCVWMSPDGTYIVVGNQAPHELNGTTWRDRFHVRWANRHADLLGRPALQFYTRGKPTRTANLREMMTYPSEFPVNEYAVEGTGILWLKWVRLDDEAMTFTAIAHDGTRTGFDLRTGELVQRIDGPMPLRQMVAIGGTVVLVGLGLFFLIWWRRRRQRPAASSPGNDEPGPNGTGSAVGGGGSDSTPPAR